MTTSGAPKRTFAGQSASRWLIWLWILLLIGFWLRLSLLLGSVYHIDEFVTMLAASMVAQRGLPILPSGLFYDHGLLVSFISGAMVALAGFKEEVARWPVLLISVFTICAYYVTAQRLFDSRITGLLAATLATFEPSSIVWGTRARMYTPAHLFVLLSVVFLLEGTLKRPSQRGRYLSLVFLVAALLSHTITFLIVAPLAITLLVFTLTYRRDWMRDRRIWQQAIVALVILLAMLALVSIGQTGSTVSVQDADADAVAPLGLDFLQGFFSPGLGWSRFDNLVGFFEAPEYQWLLPVIALSLLVAVVRAARRSISFADVALLFLAVFVALVVLEMGALLTDSWSLSRYLFILALPAFLLVSAGSLTRLLRWIARFIARLLSRSIRKPAQQAWLTASISLVGLVLVVAWWGGAAFGVAQAQGTGDYHTAFAFVRENWRPGDRLMTFHPAAAYLYLGRCDYYANQTTALVLREEGDGASLVDRYTGSPLIDSVEELNSTLAGGHRTWFVVDQHRLFNRYEPFFVQQVFAQMDFVHQSGEVYVFVSHTYPVPLADEPVVELRGDFNHLISLEGYSLDETSVAPDGTVSLGLYWRPIGDPQRALKIFVHVRDGEGQTIAQADHFIFENLLTSGEWLRLREEGEWVRDTATLRVPLPLPVDGGPYRIYVGVYDPNNFERVPVLNDTSGENAVVIDLPDLP